MNHIESVHYETFYNPLLKGKLWCVDTEIMRLAVMLPIVSALTFQCKHQHSKLKV